MALTQTQYGKAYEYACVLALEQVISPTREVRIEQNGSLEATKRNFEGLNEDMQATLMSSASAGAKGILKLEPKILEDGDDELSLSIQADAAGIAGDVRDILVLRRSIHWEIGLSVKHNHFAAKHSRLSPKIDFGKEWFGLPCSEEYWDSIRPIFDYVGNQKVQQKAWSEVPDKIKTIYQPLLRSFMAELKRLDAAHPGKVPQKLLEYLIGRNDFYKVISKDAERKTIIQSYNLHGTLNQPSTTQKPSLRVGKLKLPTAIRYFDFSDSTPDNTVDLIMNENWSVSFRIHSASTLVENSLKFDIQITGVPSSIFTQHASW